MLKALWDSLRVSLRRLQRRLKRALASPQARQVMTALLARRLPGVLRILVEGLADPDKRGFLFWWLVVTLVMTMVLTILLSIVLLPVSAALALVAVGVWMLVKKRPQPAAQSA